MGHAHEEEIPHRRSLQCGIGRANAGDGGAALSLRGHSHTRGDMEATYASRFVRRRWAQRAKVVKTGGECCRVTCGYRSRKTSSCRGMSESWDRYSLDWRSNHHQSFRGARDCRCSAGRRYSRHDQEPYEPDLELWIGAIERINKAGITKMMAVHSGFSTYREHLYRNRPIWRIPIELRRRLPDLPLICDPSHICGTRNYIMALAQQAMVFLFDGLMIEVHCAPPASLSDARQQLTPLQYGRLI